MLSLSFCEKSNSDFKKLVPTIVDLVYSSKESAINSTVIFDIDRALACTGIIGNCSSRLTVSNMTLVVSTAVFAVLSSVISLGLIESTAASAFLR